MSETARVALAKGLVKSMRNPWDWVAMDAETWKMWLMHVDAGVAALEAAGFVVRLREPTEVMIRAGRAEIKPDRLPADDGDARACWRAMIEAGGEP